VILALGIGVLLMAALYIALDIQIGNTHEGRKLVEEADVARAVLNRFTEDVSTNLGPIDPKLVGNAAIEAAATGTDSGTTDSGTTEGGTTEAGGTTTTNQSTTNQSTTNQNTTTSGSGAAPFVFNLMVQGNESQLVLYVGQLPRELQLIGGLNPDVEAPELSGLRRITYWLAGGADAPLGLARQEVKVATAQTELNNLMPDTTDETTHVIAEQVRGVAFEYFDGSTWQTEWNGLQMGEDGKTPIGPPMAIAITLTVARSKSGARLLPGAAAQEEQLRTFRQVIAIPTANNLLPQAAAGAAEGTTPTGGSTP
jgi:hypothetical protein